MFLPPDTLRARLDLSAFDLKHAPVAVGTHPCPVRSPLANRRGFLRAAAGLVAAGLFEPAMASPGGLVFNLDQQAASTAASAAPEVAQPGSDQPQPELVAPAVPQQPAMKQLALGEIPADFWEQPRELNLQRGKEHLKIVYWRDGQLCSDGYWAACRLLRDLHVNEMTYMDPAMLDILRGITGYYEAWNWVEPIMITSGFRTLATNNSLRKEGAALNSMHLYGRATDLYMQGIPPAHLAQLGLYFHGGGVGFYPQRGFVHLDTGRLRTWRG